VQREINRTRHEPVPRVGRSLMGLIIRKPNNWNKQKLLDHPHCDLTDKEIEDAFTFDFGNGPEAAVRIHRYNYDVNDELLQELMDEGV